MPPLRPVLPPATLLLTAAAEAEAVVVVVGIRREGMHEPGQTQKSC